MAFLYSLSLYSEVGALQDQSKITFLMFTCAFPLIFEEISQPKHARKKNKKHSPHHQRSSIREFFHHILRCSSHLKKNLPNMIYKKMLTATLTSRQTYWYVLLMGEHCVTLQGVYLRASAAVH